CPRAGRLAGGRRRLPYRLDAIRRHGARPGLSLQDERLHPGPQFVLVRFAPDAAHLGPRVPADNESDSPVPRRGRRPPGPTHAMAHRPGWDRAAVRPAQPMRWHIDWVVTHAM